MAAVVLTGVSSVESVAVSVLNVPVLISLGTVGKGFILGEAEEPCNSGLIISNSITCILPGLPVLH